LIRINFTEEPYFMSDSSLFITNLVILLLFFILIYMTYNRFQKNMLSLATIKNAY
jgi:hypothetical protein